MIDKETARRIALAEIDTSFDESETEAIECVILDEYTIEKDYGWVFFYQSKQYVETGDFNYSLIGNGPFIVRKEGRAVEQFGTAFTTEWYLKGYEAGFRSGAGRLTITRVFHIGRTLSCLCDLRLMRIPLEFTEGRYPQIRNDQEVQRLIDQGKLYYSWWEILRMLFRLPAVFDGVGIAVNYETFLKMDASRCCDYTLERDDQRPHPTPP